MGRRRISKDGHKLSNLELQHRFQDQAACIDEELDEAFSKIDWKRRNFAMKTLKNFIDTYMIGFQLEDAPSEMMYQVIENLQKSMLDCRPVQLQLHRGAGKTTIVSIAILYIIAAGLRKFCVIVSQNARSAANILKDIWRMVYEESAFSEDFPELCKPFQLANGGFRRRQTYKGKEVGVQKNASNIVFPRLLDDNGNDLPTSASAITVRGITSGIRGLKLPAPTGRPDCVLIDDILDAKSAMSEEQNQKLLDIIHKDIFNLSSGKKLGVVMTSTPLEADDLTQKLKNDINWKTIIYPAIVKYPKDIIEHPDDGLWQQYFKLYDKELIDDTADHTESLNFYKQHFDEMNEGAKTFANRFKPEDGHISGLQALLEKQHLIGNAAFQSEMQLSPMKATYSIDITPNIVASRLNDAVRLEVPDGYIYVAAAIDLNVSYAMSWAIVAFKRDMTAVVIEHDIWKCRIDQKLSDTAYNKAVYDQLVQLCQHIKSLNVKIDGIAIDAGGRNWDAVCSFCKSSYLTVKLPCCAFAGRASHQFNPFVRSRLRDAIGCTVLCGSPEEHVKAGAGQKYVLFDADKTKEMVQRGFMNNVGSVGSLSLFSAYADEHVDFAMQVCNEKLKYISHKKDGRDFYTWKTKEPHDFLDVLSMCFAVAMQAGMSSQNFIGVHDSGQRAKAIEFLKSRAKQKRYKFV